MWKNSHWILTGDWKKDSCISKAVHTLSVRKLRKIIRLGPVPLGEDSEEKGDYTGRHPPWGVSALSHTPSILVLESCAEDTSPLGCLEDHCDRQKGWRRLHSACEECTAADLPSVQDRERSTLIVARFPITTSPSCANTCVPQPKLSKHSACLIPHHSMALDLGPQGLWDAEAEGIILSEFRLYYKATVNKTARYCTKIDTYINGRE